MHNNQTSVVALFSHTTKMSMAKPVQSLPVLCIFLLLLCFNSGLLRLVHGQAPGQGSWCVAKPSSSDEELTANMSYACGYVDCSRIQKDGACFYPETLINYASVAMNIYYQEQGRHFWNCDFKKSGIIVVTDPSYDDCVYEYVQ